MYHSFYKRRKPNPLRTISHWLAVLVGSGLIIFALFKGGVGLYNWVLNKPATTQETETIIFTVEKGESVRSIGAKLEEKGLILSDTVFYLYVRTQNAGEKIKAGKFILHKNDTIPAIVTILTGEATGEVVLTIPEGWTIADIQKSLEEKELDPQKTFSPCATDAQTCGINNYSGSLEGYLFPDTYFLDPTAFDAKSLIELLLATFTTKVQEELASEIAEQNHTLTDIIIMASIIEKEVRTDADRAIVAGILWKRLENNWPLGADATLLYTDDDGVLDAASLAEEDPYNTRNRQGLPPTPICNPGIEAIRAALNPKDSPYWFYLTDSEGTVHYAVTNEQHNANKTEYLS